MTEPEPYFRGTVLGQWDDSSHKISSTICEIMKICMVRMKAGIDMSVMFTKRWRENAIVRKGEEKHNIREYMKGGVEGET